MGPCIKGTVAFDVQATMQSLRKFYTFWGACYFSRRVVAQSLASSVELYLLAFKGHCWLVKRALAMTYDRMAFAMSFENDRFKAANHSRF